MRKRVQSIVRQLLSEPSWVSSKELARRLGISRRALAYALDELDDVLCAEGLSRVERLSGRGVRVPAGERARIGALLEDAPDGGAVIDLVDVKSRRLFLAFTILCVDARSTVEQLAAYAQVSTRTLSNDVKAIRQTLSAQNIDLVFDKHRGYRVVGNVFILRSLLLAELREACPMNTCQEVVSTLEGLFGLAGREFDAFDVTALAELASTLEDVLPNHYERSVRWTILLQLVLLSVELDAPRDYGLNDADRAYLKRGASFEMSRFLRSATERTLGVSISPDEDYYLGTLLQSLPTTGADTGDHIYPFELEVMAQRLILAVSEGYDFDFQADQEIFSIVASHMIPLVYRLRFNAQISNPMVSDIVTKYARLHGVVRESLRELERYVGTSVSDDECAFFTLYFASSIEKLANARQGRARVVIVCNAGNAVSRLLQYKLLNAFSLDVVATTSAAELPRVLAASGQVDLVVSVVDVDPAACGETPFIRVSALVSADDYDLLSRYLSRRVFALADDHDASGKGLLDLLPPECFELLDGVEDMDDLIAWAGGLLFGAGLCDEEYPRQMISAAHCFGPLTTILIAPGIIMPHAGISDHVLGTGFSFVGLERPVVVNGKEVFCALALCTTDKKLNQRAIRQIGILLSRSDFMRRVRGADSYDRFAWIVTDCLKGAERK